MNRTPNAVINLKSTRFCLKVIAGLKELHDLGFLQRDFNSEKIVIGQEKPIKVAFIDNDGSLTAPINPTMKREAPHAISLKKPV